MAKFVYICDTHLGANPMGYFQQAEYAPQLPHLLTLLSDWIRADNTIDFVLHGGDMIDETCSDSLTRAGELFTLPVPLHLCLGNHDLTEPDALTQWQTALPQFFPNGQAQYSLSPPGCRVHVVPNHWGAQPYYWNREQGPHVPSLHEIEALRGWLSEDPDLPHIVATHAPTRGLPTEQTGFDAPYHASDPAFMNIFDQLTRDFPQLRLILSAHSHLNLHVHDGHVHHVGCSAFVETPFEFKVIEVLPERISMQTISLADQVSWQPAYDFNKSYVQGRPCDRAFEDSSTSV